MEKPSPVGPGYCDCYGAAHTREILHRWGPVTAIVMVPRTPGRSFTGGARLLRLLWCRAHQKGYGRGRVLGQGSLFPDCAED